MDESEATLPKSAIVRIVRETLPGEVRVASDTQDLLVKCSTEFVQLLATESNEVRYRTSNIGLSDQSTNQTQNTGKKIVLNVETGFP